MKSRTGAALTITLYGIPNCDQVKKARSWLSEHGFDIHFHDYKKAGVTAGLIKSWLPHLDREMLINRRGTTWRALSKAEQEQVVDDASAIAQMIKTPSIIKRPILIIGDQNSIKSALAGFSEDQYQQLLA